MNMSFSRRGGCAVLAAVLWMSPFGPFVRADDAALRPHFVSFEEDTDEKTGIDFRLSEVKSAAPASERVPVAPAEKLSDAETAALLARLPAQRPPAPEEPFRFPVQTVPRPKTGNVLPLLTPPKESPRPAEIAGPLEVLRYAPEGGVPVVPNLTVTFSQPMIPVGSAEAAVVTNPPVELTPQPPGRWRWLNTRTLFFEPDGRFPMATIYEARIPAGTRSATGGMLGKEVRWVFATPPPTVERTSVAGQTLSRKPVIAVLFNQRMDPDAVLKLVRATVNDAPVTVALATPADIAADRDAELLMKSARPGYAVAFKLTAPGGGPLPSAMRVTLTIPRRLPSAEGPRLSETERPVTFSTVGAFAVVRKDCGDCEPSDALTIGFNQDIRDFDPSLVTVEPKIELQDINVYGKQMYISGWKKPRTVYRVTLSPRIRSVLGEELGPTAPLMFLTGNESPAYSVPGNDLVVLDPFGKPRLWVDSINHQSFRVTIRRVVPADWIAYQTARSQSPDNRVLPGRVVFSGPLTVKNSPNQYVETALDLAPYLKGDTRHLLVRIEPLKPPADDDSRRNPREELRWVSLTDIGLDATADAESLTVRAISLRDRKPLANVDLTLFPQRDTARTDENGMATIPLKVISEQETGMLLARLGNDTALLPPEETSYYSSRRNWRRMARPSPLRWFVFDDRGLYKPGERVRFKGWLRQIAFSPTGDVTIPGANLVSRVKFEAKDERGILLGSGECTLDAVGGFDGAFDLAPGVNTGNAWLRLYPQGVFASSDAGYHQFKIAEFRRPEFEAKVTPDAAGPFIAGNPVTLTSEATYFAGGALAGAETDWSVRTETTDYSPPNWNDFTFGEWRPWWERSSRYSGYRPGRHARDDGRRLTGRADDSGRHSLKIEVDRISPPGPVRLTAEATSKDVNRQAVSAKTSVLVHPSSVYVGVRSARTFTEGGQAVEFETVVTDIDGKPVAGRPVQVRFARLESVVKDGEHVEVEKDAREQVIASGDGPVRCAFQPGEGGRYRVTVTTTDGRERPNRSRLTVWVAGSGSWSADDGEDGEPRKLELIPGKREYAGSETAEILVRSAFPDADGLLFITRNGVVRSERFKMTGTTHVLRIPVEERWTPNVHLAVNLVGAVPRTDNPFDDKRIQPMQPVIAEASLELNIPPVARKLAVTAIPEVSPVEPGGESAVTVRVRDVNGAPVAGSQVAVVVADESILTLGEYRLDDPFGIFYPRRESDIWAVHSQKSVIQDHDPYKLERGGVAGGIPGGTPGGGVGGGAGGGGRMGLVLPAAKGRLPEASLKPEEMIMDPDSIGSPIQLRTNFDPLANFSPSVTTDTDGLAVVKVKFPDNLTRYRVTAVAVSGEEYFGTGESNVTARLPLMVRPSAPRFLNYGDQCEFPVVIQNQSGSPQTVAVAIRTSNARLLDGAGRRVTIPANDRVEVRFPMTAEHAGEARFEIAAAAPGVRPDGAYAACPVYNPQVSEAFATYGELDAGAVAQPVAVPAGALPGYGKLEVTASATQLQALTDATVYLARYPYECSEQISSRILAAVTTRDVVSQLGATDVPSRADLSAAIRENFARLEKIQKPNGGFAFWTKDGQEFPYLGVFVALAGQQALAHDVSVPSGMYRASLDYLQNIERYIPTDYSDASRRSLIAFALSVRARAGTRDRAKIRQLVSEGLEKLPLEAVGWLLLATAGDADLTPEREALLKWLNNRVTETAGKAHFVTAYEDKGDVMLSSSHRADGIILDALIATDPKNDLIPKLARGLLDARTQGRWATTQENVFALLALERYFRTYENVTPDFVARLWLGEKFAGEQAFRGRTADSRQLAVPLGEIPATGAPLTLQKDGAGRLYYRVAMTYAPLNPDPNPFAAGFEVERIYEAVDDPADVRRDPDGTWHFRAGARIRVKVSFSTNSVKQHVALADPLPAGLEALNPELAGTQEAPPGADRESGGKYWWWGPWYSHRNLRDDRAEAFAERVWAGSYTFAYYARATTPGVFRVAPAKAEEMYHPETFGRTGAGRVVVE